jgi:tetratricopeptide (TPR) repeat protein
MARPRTASARDKAEVPGEPPPLSFRLALDDGRAVLDLPEGGSAGLVRVDRLRLEIPEVRYPFDLSAGLNRFQDRRCLLRELQVVVPAPTLGGWLATAPLARFGLHHPWVSATPGGLRLVLRAELGGCSTLVTGRVALQPHPGGRLRLSIQMARAYGFLPVPVPLVMAGLLTALGALPAGGPPRPQPSPAAVPGERWWARPPALVATTGPTELELSALDLVLYPLLAERGWRLPERRAVALAEVGIDGDELRLGFRTEGDGIGAPVPAPVPAEGGDLFALGEEALAAGELRAAREAYRHAAAAAPGGQAEERLLALLLAGADTLPAAAEEAAGQLARRPDDSGARLAQAVVAAEEQRFDEAASLYQRVAARSEAEGEPLEAACARYAASEALERAGRSGEARAELSRALAAWGDEPAPLRQLWTERLAGQEVVVVEPAAPEALVRARAAWREGDLSAAARQYEGVLEERDAGEGAAEAHLRLAQWARLNGQMMVASRHLGQALKLEGEPARAAPLEVLVEVLDASGRIEELESALVRRHKRAGTGSAGGAVARALGQVLERAGRAPAAVNVYEQLLVEAPADGQILGRLAEIHRRESQHAELASALERLFALGLAHPGGADIDVEAVGLELAQLHDEALGARDRAAVVLEQLCAACPSSSEAREALAALDRRPAGAED